jgi:hypothetical protein
MRAFATCAVLAAAMASGGVLADTLHGRFNVNISLRHDATGPGGSGICVSEALGASTNAIVRVACQNGQFVSISPLPGQPFAGTHGGAFRFSIGPGNWIEASLAGTADAILGMGTVTAMRIYRADEGNEPLELLVSF